MDRMFPGEADLVLERTGLPGGGGGKTTFTFAYQSYIRHIKGIGKAKPHF